RRCGSNFGASAACTIAHTEMASVENSKRFMAMILYKMWIDGSSGRRQRWRECIRQATNAQRITLAGRSEVMLRRVHDAMLHAFMTQRQVAIKRQPGVRAACGG